MSVLLIVVGVIFIVIGLLLIVLMLFIISAGYQVQKFMFDLPWLKWLTLNEIIRMGFSRFWAQFILPGLHKEGMLEVRVGGGELPDEVEQRFIDVVGFGPTTIQFYEFRLTKRGGRKKFKLPIKNLVGALQPARA